MFASDTRWNAARGKDFEEGPSEGLPARSRHVDDPILNSNRTVAWTSCCSWSPRTNNELMHEAPAIVGRQTPSALAPSAMGTHAQQPYGSGSSMKPLDIDLSGRVALVTGANSGMGRETARALARMGAEVILGCRSTQRGEAARTEITDSTGARAVTVIALDLSSLASVRAFATAFHERFATLDVLVNNAAASLMTREVTPEGFERHWATNVLGPHLLTTLLIPALRASGHGRIVTVSTRAAGGLDLSDTQYERRRYRGTAAYRASKQAARMLTWAVADDLKEEPVTANAVNPGYVLTPLTVNVNGPLKLLISVTGFAAQTASDGADTAVWAVASPELEGLTGKFWTKRHEIRCRFRNPAEIHRLVAIVEQQLSQVSSLGAGIVDREANESAAHADVQ